MFNLEIIALVALLFLFILLVYAGVKTLFRYIIVTGASAIFPLILILVFGVNLPLTLETILTFVYIGLFGYGIYRILSVFEIIGKFIGKLFGIKTDEEKKLEKRIDKLEKQNKEKVKKLENQQKTEERLNRLEEDKRKKKNE